MTEEEARSWLQTTFDVSRETWDRLNLYVAMLLSEMDHQNLIAASTRPHIWDRHVVDSAQLLNWTDGASDGVWVDLGSGAGLPAIIAACLSPRPVLMIESRRKRVEFLRSVIDHLALTHAEVFEGKVENACSVSTAVISARAYAPLPKLLSSAIHLSTEKTRWVLPKGRNAENELEATTPSWQGVFHVERSVTDAESAIIVAHGVKAKAGKGQR